MEVSIVLRLPNTSTGERNAGSLPNGIVPFGQWKGLGGGIEAGGGQPWVSQANARNQTKVKPQKKFRRGNKPSRFLVSLTHCRVFKHDGSCASSEGIQSLEIRASVVRL